VDGKDKMDDFLIAVNDTGNLTAQRRRRSRGQVDPIGGIHDYPHRRKSGCVPIFLSMNLS